jgi:hypothetical protein
MPSDPEKPSLLNTMIDVWLEQRKLDQAEGIDDITDPLDAPPSEPFYHDGSPEKIHGQPNQELWPPKPHKPVPIETL